MGKIYLLIAALCFVFYSEAQTYKYQVITSVESIIPSGAGRSRLISTNESRNYQDFTSERTDGKTVKDKRNKLTEEGWELAFVSSAVESDAGKNDGRGIFITRYILKN